MGHTEPYNLFGVVIDSTLPYAKRKMTEESPEKPDSRKKNPMAMCTLKMVDHSLNIKAAQILKDFKGAGNQYQNSSTQAKLTFFGYDRS